MQRHLLSKYRQIRFLILIFLTYFILLLGQFPGESPDHLLVRIVSCNSTHDNDLDQFHQLIGELPLNLQLKVVIHTLQLTVLAHIEH